MSKQQLYYLTFAVSFCSRCKSGSQCSNVQLRTSYHDDAFGYGSILRFLQEGYVCAQPFLFLGCCVSSHVLRWFLLCGRLSQRRFVIHNGSAFQLRDFSAKILESWFSFEVWCSSIVARSCLFWLYQFRRTYSTFKCYYWWVEGRASLEFKHLKSYNPARKYDQ